MILSGKYEYATPPIDIYLSYGVPVQHSLRALDEQAVRELVEERRAGLAPQERLVLVDASSRGGGRAVGGGLVLLHHKINHLV